ncbi:MAG: hypothetical protein ACOYLQ_12670 [Hyphomicrobiaceae bacterium]
MYGRATALLNRSYDMAYEVTTGLDYDIFDRNDKHARHTRQVMDASGRQISIETFFERGDPVPEELLEELPYKIVLRNDAKVGFMGNFAAFLFEAAAYDVLAASGALHWHHPVPLVVDEDERPLDQRWYVVAIPLLDRPRHVVDIANSSRYVETPAPYKGTGGVKIEMTHFLGKLAFFKNEIAGLKFWRGVGGRCLTGDYFCSEDFRRSWDATGLKGLTFKPVIEADAVWAAYKSEKMKGWASDRAVSVE